MSLQYGTVHLALTAALPELCPCIERLVVDWDNFGGEPPSQYLVFETYQVWIQALVGSAHRDTEARELTRRAFALAEQMLSSEEPELRYLAIDACAEMLDMMPSGHEIVAEIGGAALRG